MPRLPSQRPSLPRLASAAAPRRPRPSPPPRFLRVRCIADLRGRRLCRTLVAPAMLILPARSVSRRGASAPLAAASCARRPPPAALLHVGSRGPPHAPPGRSRPLLPSRVRPRGLAPVRAVPVSARARYGLWATAKRGPLPRTLKKTKMKKLVQLIIN